MAPTVGYWGPPSTNLDWCENNYEFSPHIAEFWNTISNLWMIIPPLVAMVIGLKDEIERKMLLCYGLLIVVGIGSWCFHMTLLYYMQLLDELPMLWAASALIYAVCMVDKPRSSTNHPLLFLLIFYDIIVIVVYLMTYNALFFQIAYGVMVLGLLAVSTFMLSFRNVEYSLMLYVLAIVLYATGFLLWTIDNKYCSQLQSIRTDLIFPVQSFTQLHAWWHCLAGLGSFFSISCCVFARAKFLRKSVRIEYHYGLPYVRQSEKYSA